MKRIVKALLCALAVYGTVNAASPAASPGQDKAGAMAAKEDKGYRIDKPGTITFTVGITVKGKVEKPQVIIFLPKEKPVYRTAPVSMSFLQDIMKPIPFVPVVQ
jgi:hypothetical protein